MTRRVSHEAGFSLIELMVAMVITLIVSGAIYGLLAGGQNAFRREPELTERQQNIRMSMDVIMRDVANAGAGLPAFMQVFTPNLDACTTCPNGGSQMGPNGAVRDELEIMSSTGRDTEPACFTGGAATAGTTIELIRRGQNIPAKTVVGLVFANDTWTLRQLITDSNPSTTSGEPSCTGNHTQLSMAAGGTVPLNTGTLCGPSATTAILPPLGNAPGVGTCTVTAVAFPRLVRYRIRPDLDGVPMLERFSTDNVDGGFQTIARGIEDLQVQYTTLQDPGIWVDNAPLVPAPEATTPIGNWDDLTQQVRVTLTARSEARNIQGAMNDSSGANPRIRGSLTSTGTPRAILMHVAAAHPASPYPPSPAAWYWE
jgi:type IV pilus assembly protein PilW